MTVFDFSGEENAVNDDEGMAFSDASSLENNSKRKHPVVHDVQPSKPSEWEEVTSRRSGDIVVTTRRKIAENSGAEQYGVRVSQEARYGNFLSGTILVRYRIEGVGKARRIVYDTPDFEETLMVLLEEAMDEINNKISRSLGLEET